MLKLIASGKTGTGVSQPPLGGCVLKLKTPAVCLVAVTQPPLGGCVLKQKLVEHGMVALFQPPLGGCVLKLRQIQTHCRTIQTSRL